MKIFWIQGFSGKAFISSFIIFTIYLLPEKNDLKLEKIGYKNLLNEIPKFPRFFQCCKKNFALLTPF